MRDIKFRAWDKRLKIMITHEKFLECGRLMILKMKQLYEDQPDINNAKGGIMLNIDDENMEFMQYTGLSDIHGNEIFEGDVVQYKMPMCSGFYKRKIIYSKKHAGFVAEGTNFMPDTRYDVEVIGNIYDNPEIAK